MMLRDQNQLHYHVELHYHIILHYQRRKRIFLSQKQIQKHPFHMETMRGMNS